MYYLLFFIIYLFIVSVLLYYFFKHLPLFSGKVNGIFRLSVTDRHELL